MGVRRTTSISYRLHAASYTWSRHVSSTLGLFRTPSTLQNSTTVFGSTVRAGTIALRFTPVKPLRAEEM